MEGVQAGQARWTFELDAGCREGISRCPKEKREKEEEGEGDREAEREERGPEGREYSFRAPGQKVLVNPVLMSPPTQQAGDCNRPYL